MDEPPMLLDVPIDDDSEPVDALVPVMSEEDAAALDDPTELDEATPTLDDNDAELLAA